MDIIAGPVELLVPLNLDRVLLVRKAKRAATTGGLNVQGAWPGSLTATTQQTRTMVQGQESQSR